MTAANFDKCLKLVLVHEGGNDDDPQDPGGRTSRGIIQREYTSWRRGKGLPTADVWRATDDEIHEIYHSQYWLPWCDQLPTGVDYIAFDMFVNMGMAQGAKLIQRASGVEADGHMGLCTLDAIENCSDKAALIHKISDRRREFYKSLRTFGRFGKGWLRRTDDVEKDATAMVDITTEPSVDLYAKAKPDTAQRSYNEKPDDTTLSMPPEAAGASTAGIGTATAVLDQAQQQLAPYSNTISYVKYGLLALTLAGVFITLWGYYKRSKAQQAMN